MLRKWLMMFGIGGGVYVLLELWFRGRSHVSMFFAGGLSSALIFSGCCVGKRKKMCLFHKCAIGSAIITAVEFLTGVIVNLWLRLKVWDYSALPYNLLGQVCLPFSLLWFVLTLPVLGVGTLLDRCAFQPFSLSRKRRKPASPLSSGR